MSLYKAKKNNFFFLFLYKLYLTYVNVCSSLLEHGNFCLVSGPLSLKRHNLSRDTIRLGLYVHSVIVHLILSI